MPRINWFQRLAVPALTCAVGVALGVSSASGSSPNHSPFRNLSVFARALSHLELSYVDPVDQDALIDGAIEGMAASLDPHTAYLPAERYQRLLEDTEGKYGGIGVEIMARDGWLTVTNVFADSPAAHAGLQAGDRVLSIDEVPARDMRMTDALDRVRGPIGTSVDLAILRIDNSERMQLSKRVTRQAIKIDPVTLQIRDRLAVIRIAAFTEKAAEQLERHLKHTNEDNDIDAIVIDLRGNAGGLLDQAARAADLFVSRGTIVTTRGRGNVILASYKADQDFHEMKRPLFVWIDPFTASAAEILAAALQEQGVGLLVGHQTWGKGSVQNIVELPDGSALKVTVARYFSGRGRSIQAAGIAPDIELAEPDFSLSEQSLPRHLKQVSPLQTDASVESTVGWNKAHRQQAQKQQKNCKKKDVDHQACTRLIVDALRSEDS